MLEFQVRTWKSIPDQRCVLVQSATLPSYACKACRFPFLASTLHQFADLAVLALG